MNSAVRARRITLGLLLGAALVAGGVCWQRSSIESTPGHLSRRRFLLPPPPTAAADSLAEDGKAAAPVRYRACLLLRLLPSSSPAIHSTSHRITELKASAILTAAISALDLSGRWSTDPDAALFKLGAMVQMASSPDSPLTGTLSVTSPGQKEAAEIADALVTAFKNSLETSESDQTNRLAVPVYRQIKALTESVERARNQLLECMNSRLIVDYAFLDSLNKKPGAIQPELDASLNPDIKLAWFSHQLDTLKSMPWAASVDYLAGAALPFDDEVTKLCRTWQDLAPTYAAVADGETGKSFETQKSITQSAIDAYRDKLQEWVTQTAGTLPPEDPHQPFSSTTDRKRQEEYRALKRHYEAGAESLKALQENAARLFGNDAPIYVPPLVVLKRSVERLPR